MLSKNNKTTNEITQSLDCCIAKSFQNMLLFLHVCMIRVQYAYACEGLGKGHPCVMESMQRSGNNFECRTASSTLSEDVHLLTAVYVSTREVEGESGVKLACS